MSEKYTGKALNVKTNERGLEFDVVITKSNGEEVLRRKQWVSTGVMTAVQAKDAVLNVVERMTQDIWAHFEGAKEAILDKERIEAFKATCEVFVPTKDRVSPQSTRGTGFVSELTEGSEPFTPSNDD